MALQRFATIPDPRSPSPGAWGDAHVASPTFADFDASNSDDDSEDPVEALQTPGCALRTLIKVDLRFVSGLRSTAVGVRKLRAALSHFAQILL